MYVYLSFIVYLRSGSIEEWRDDHRWK